MDVTNLINRAAYNKLSKEMIKTINGNAPDENGNINISGQGSGTGDLNAGLITIRISPQ